jgi:hypothetical protein
MIFHSLLNEIEYRFYYLGNQQLLHWRDRVRVGVLRIMSSFGGSRKPVYKMMRLVHDFELSELSGILFEFIIFFGKGPFWRFKILNPAFIFRCR